MASLRKRGEFWYIRCRTLEGKQTETKASRDKQVARRMMGELENQLQRIKLGQLDPREAGCLEAERVPITKHVQDYVAHLKALGRVPEHVLAVKKRLEWLIDETKIGRLSQLRPSLVTSALATLRERGRADLTIAHACTTIKAFSRWAKRDRRTTIDLLEDLDRPPVLSEQKRQALLPDQLSRLIAVTHGSRPRRKLSGPDRAWLYHLAALTGLRRSELQSLTPQSFDLDGSPATVRVDATETKNGKEAIQPLPDRVVADLRSWLASKPVDARIFPHDRNSSLMIKADLRAAGIPSDAFCFHSLRHSYATLIDGTGATTKEAMTLARHSDPDLTLNRYTHTQLERLGRVVNNLPDLRPACGQVSLDASFAHNLTTSPVTSCHPLAQSNPVKHCLKLPEGDMNSHLCNYTRLDSNQ